ncbi:MAG TPA: argininosuccinate lyase [Candidatus Polarisedimenticolia bacterium]|nr:argininosuccinate lyase [Candidatus Polarisedimenticolia bacterium]
MKRPKKEPGGGGAGRLWGGGFREPLDPGLEAFCESFSFDRRLLRVDLEVNRAWVEALCGAGVLDAAEAARLDAALATLAEAPLPASTGAPIDATVARGGQDAPEDVHTYVEAAVAARVGADLAGKLRTGRSRNDLVATDLRLWCREEIAALRRALASGVLALADLASRAGGLAVPGYTHLRRAQPILLAHLLLAHAHRLTRDDDRFAETLRRLDACPLGSGALAGTTAKVDRRALARRLGFARPAANSLDAVSDRDFVADALFACTLTMIHLSQIAEDLILATAEEFGWLALADAASTGSSLMPQKKNPDVLELIRGKSGRVAGRLAGFLATLKGLPAAYNRDLQEDKEPLFDAVDTTGGALRALTILLQYLKPVPARGLPEEAGDLLATDLADVLADQGVPFARAHHLAGEAAEQARRQGSALARLPVETLRSISPLFGNDLAERLTTAAALARRDREGGTAPARVAEDLQRVRSWAAARLGDGIVGRAGEGLSIPLEEGAVTPGDWRAAAEETAPDDGNGAARDPEVRLRHAGDEDLHPIEGRIRRWSERGVLLPLEGRALRAALPDFRVLSPKGSPRTLLAFASLRRYSPGLAEIRSLVVDDAQRGRGLGRRLIGHLLDEARGEGLKRVFVLTRTPDFFERIGFARVPRESLPQKVFVDCSRCARRERCDEQALVRELGKERR